MTSNRLSVQHLEWWIWQTKCLHEKQGRLIVANLYKTHSFSNKAFALWVHLAVMELVLFNRLMALESVDKNEKGGYINAQCMEDLRMDEKRKATLNWRNNDEVDGGMWALNCEMQRIWLMISFIYAADRITPPSTLLYIEGDYVRVMKRLGGYELRMKSLNNLNGAWNQQANPSQEKGKRRYWRATNSVIQSDSCRRLFSTVGFERLVFYGRNLFHDHICMREKNRSENGQRHR